VTWSLSARLPAVEETTDRGIEGTLTVMDPAVVGRGEEFLEIDGVAGVEVVQDELESLVALGMIWFFKRRNWL